MEALWFPGIKFWQRLTVWLRKYLRMTLKLIEIRHSNLYWLNLYRISQRDVKLLTVELGIHSLHPLNSTDVTTKKVRRMTRHRRFNPRTFVSSLMYIATIVCSPYGKLKWYNFIWSNIWGFLVQRHSNPDAGIARGLQGNYFTRLLAIGKF